MDILEQRQKFNEIAKVIQKKTGETAQFSANRFIEKIRSIDRLIPMTNIVPSTHKNGYLGNEVCRCAKSYLDTRYLSENRIRWNYNDTSIFDNNGNSFYLRGLPKRFKHDGVTESAQWVDHTQHSRANLNIIDCSTFVGLCLRGIDYAHSPYAQISGGTWNPHSSSNGIRKLTNRDGAPAWKQDFLDYQPVESGMDVVTLGYSDGFTVRTAAGLAELYYKIGQVIYDGKKEGSLLPITENSKTVGFKSPADNTDMFDKLLPGDLIFWSSSTASDNQKARFRGVSHVGISSENPRYYYEATTMLETLYYRDLLPTTATPNGKFPEISLIIRPDYRPRVQEIYTIPLNVNLLEFPWTFSRITTEDKFNNLKRKNPSLSDAEIMSSLLISLNNSSSSRGLWWKMIGKSKIGVWGNNSSEVYASLAGSTAQEYAYNHLTLTPGTYVLHLEHDGTATTGNNINTTGYALQIKKAGTTSDLLINKTTNLALTSLETSSLGDYTVDEDTGDIILETQSESNTKSIRAKNGTDSTFIITENTDVCIRLYVGPNSDSGGNGYIFGNYSSEFDHLTDTKEYVETIVSLIRTS